MHHIQTLFFEIYWGAFNSFLGVLKRGAVVEEFAKITTEFNIGTTI